MQWLLKQIFLDCLFFIGTNNFFISVLFHWYFTSLTSFILTLAHNKVIKHAQLLLNYLSQNLNWNSTEIIIVQVLEQTGLGGKVNLLSAQTDFVLL